MDTRETRDHWREVKFLIAARLGERVVEWARATLAPDASGAGPFGDEYATTTLYFETPRFDVFHRRGSFGRAKYRARRYGLADAVYLERKFRTDRLLAKRRTAVPLADLERLGRPPSACTWAGHWFHRRLIARGLQPLVQVTYDRLARTGPSPNGTIRLTVDRNLRVLPMPDRAFLPGTGLPVLDEQWILELKYRVDLPAVFKTLVETFALDPAPVSKYRLGLAKLDYSPAARLTEGHHA
jgi:hypothetical protein